MSDGMSVQIEGLDRVVTALNELKPKTATRIYSKLGTAAYNVLQASQAEVPVDQGDLKASGHIEIDFNESGNAYADVIYGDGSSAGTYNYPDNGLMGDMQADGYAWFVELGTVHMPARPYLGPAFEEQSQILVDSLGNLLET